MKKIPTLFIRDPENPRYVTEEVHPDCQWVTRGEGVPTRKYDGTSRCPTISRSAHGASDHIPVAV